MKRMKRGFTLVEILIVVIILGILAAIVIPQFTEASNEARVSNLMTNLQTIRSQLLLYKTQHLENYPDSAATFGDQMTLFSDYNGTTAAAIDKTANPPIIFGPYLQSVPVNPITGSNAVQDTTAPGAATTDGGWYYNPATGEFRADLKDSHTTTDGTTQLNEL